MKRLLTPLVLAVTAGTTLALGSSNADAFTCVYVNAGSTSTCNYGMLTGGGYTPGWLYTGPQSSGVIENNTGGSRNISLWFANASTKIGETSTPLPAWAILSKTSPAGSVRNLEINNGAAWASTRSYVN